MENLSYYPLGKNCDGNLIVGSTSNSKIFPVLFAVEGRTYAVYKPYPADVSTPHIKQCMLYEPVSVASKVPQGSSKDEEPLLSVIDLDRRMNKAFMDLKSSNPNFTMHDVRRSRCVAIEQYFAENQASYVFESKESPDEN